jgi:hypothetical protein
LHADDFGPTLSECINAMKRAKYLVAEAMSSSHVFGQTAQNEIFDGRWREAAGDFGGVLAEFFNVHMSELRKGGKYTITGQPHVDEFSVLLRSE